jgi:hypothetical protein
MEFWKNLTPQTRQVVIVVSGVSFVAITIAAMVTGNFDTIIEFSKDFFSFLKEIL